jgi:hypothetical protein
MASQMRARRRLLKLTRACHVLSFVGPPGTEKTSSVQSIARALGRPFQRIAFGGVRDEAEIRDHLGLTSLAGLVYLHRRCARLVGWIWFYYCEHLLHFPEFVD